MPARPASIKYPAGLLFLVPLSACLGGEPVMPAPPGLAYGIPDPNPATYEFADTATFSIQAGGMGTLDVRVLQAGLAELDFRGSPTGLEVVVRVPRYSASFENPTQGASRADESGIHGPFTIALDHRGGLEVADTPSLSDAVLDIAGPESLVRPLFVHLPAREVAEGARWVDTVTTVEETDGTRSRGRTIITSTLAGDTLIQGERMLVIETESESEIEMSGTSGGTRLQQRLTGTTRGRIVWDPARRLLIERRDSGSLRGTLDLPEMGVAGLPVEGTVARRVSLSGP